jgi:hypothetical protein
MNIEHIKDYDSAMKAPWEFERAGNLPRAKKKKRHILYKLEIIHTMKQPKKMVG